MSFKECKYRGEEFLRLLKMSEMATMGKAYQLGISKAVMQGFSPFGTAYEIVITCENQRPHGETLKSRSSIKGFVVANEKCGVNPCAKRFKIKLLSDTIGKVSGE